MFRHASAHPRDAPKRGRTDEPLGAAPPAGQMGLARAVYRCSWEAPVPGCSPQDLKAPRPSCSSDSRRDASRFNNIHCDVADREPQAAPAPRQGAGLGPACAGNGKGAAPGPYELQSGRLATARGS